jgi:hypothetical protein
MIAQAVGRAGMLGDAMVYGIELGGGTATDFGRTVATGSFGFFFTLYYGEIGVAYHFPVGADRPSWLGGAQFAIRAYIPLLTYDSHESRQSRPAPE